LPAQSVTLSTARKNGGIPRLSGDLGRVTGCNLCHPRSPIAVALYIAAISATPRLPLRDVAQTRQDEPQTGRTMADLYLKSLESERRQLWATCRLKGLAKDTPERLRIAELDRLLAEHRAAKKAGERAGEKAGDPAKG